MKKLNLFLFLFTTIFAINSFADGWYFDGANWKYEDRDGSYVTGAIKKSNGISYYLDDDGNMATDYLAEVNNNFYYFDENGAMVTNTWVALDPSVIEDQPFDADVYYMYFGNNGKAIKGEDGKKKNIDGKTYMFNNNGIMMVGWMNENGEYLDDKDSDDWYSSDAMYFAHEDGSLAEGWLPLNDYHLEDEITNAAGDPLYLETIWFYFDPTTHKKNTSDKSINGKKYYFFSDSGRMMTEWEYLENEYGGSDDSFIATNDSANRYNGYFNDGSLKKNEWIYAIPSSVIDSEAYDDYEYDWFYAKSNGSLIADTKKKINNKNYLFDKNGIMQKSLIVEYSQDNTNIGGYNTNYYILRVDLDNTNGEEFIKEGKFYLKDKPIPYDDTIREIINEEDGMLLVDKCFMKKYFNGLLQYNIFYFGDDGAKKVGDKIEIEFNDGTYLFSSDNKGGYFGLKDNKFYANGFLCKANSDRGLGVVIDFNNISLVGDGVDDPCLNNIDSDEPGVIPPTPDEITIGEIPHVKELRYLDPKLFNYSKASLDMLNLVFGFGENPLSAVELIQIMTQMAEEAGIDFNMKPYEAYLPYLITMARGDIIGYGHIRGFTKRPVFVVDKNGKIKNKGNYKDADGNYWLVDGKKNFVGAFEVPVKWGKSNGVDMPYYKSTFFETNSKGEQEEKEKFMPFFTKDIFGNTELDYVCYLDDDFLVNFKCGSNDFDMFDVDDD